MTEIGTKQWAAPDGSLVEGGFFAFELMTHRGFWEDYNAVCVHDTEDDLFSGHHIGDRGIGDDLPLLRRDHGPATHRKSKDSQELGVTEATRTSTVR